MKNIEEVLRCIKEGRSVIILENSKKRRALLTEKLLSSVSNRNIVFVRNILSDNIIDSISQINSVREIQTDRNNWIQDNDYDELTNDKNSLLVANFNSFKELRFLVNDCQRIFCIRDSITWFHPKEFFNYALAAETTIYKVESKGDEMTLKYVHWEDLKKYNGE